MSTTTQHPSKESAVMDPKSAEVGLIHRKDTERPTETCSHQGVKDTQSLNTRNTTTGKEWAVCEESNRGTAAKGSHKVLSRFSDGQRKPQVEEVATGKEPSEPGKVGSKRAARIQDLETLTDKPIVASKVRRFGNSRCSCGLSSRTIIHY